MFSRIGLSLANRRPVLALSISTLMAALLASASGGASVAHGQAWLDNRGRTEGHGVRTGDLEIHPGIGAEAGYDTNNFLTATNPESTAVLRITPHIAISTLSQERRQGGDTGGAGGAQVAPTLRFRGAASASYYHFFLNSARDNISGDLSLNLVVNPEKPFSFTLNEQFIRTIRPFAAQVGTSSVSFGRNQNIIGGMMTLSTPGGLFQGRLGYDFNYNFFDGSQFQGSNNMQHTVRAGSNWRFLPQTALLYDFALDYQTYPNAADSTALVSDSVRLQSRLGLNGAITNRFSVLAMAGYSAGFFEAGDDFEAFVAQLEGRFQLNENSKIAFGYDRSVFGSYVGNYYRQDRFYLNASALFAGRVLVGADLSLALLGFGVPLAQNGTALGFNSTDVNDPSRSDVRLIAGVYSEYRFTDYLAVNATVRYTGDFTDYQYVTTDSSATFIEPAGFKKFEVWLGVRVFY
ncbi:MAG: hypothetical protein IPK60_03005 [Sandaracinaceae bacterium]|nr:hypothetical protein [Sandaracinaceae bacterium]